MARWCFWGGVWNLLHCATMMTTTAMCLRFVPTCKALHVFTPATNCWNSSQIVWTSCHTTTVAIRLVNSGQMPILAQTKLFGVKGIALGFCSSASAFRTAAGDNETQRFPSQPEIKGVESVSERRARVSYLHNTQARIKEFTRGGGLETRIRCFRPTLLLKRTRTQTSKPEVPPRRPLAPDDFCRKWRIFRRHVGHAFSFGRYLKPHLNLCCVILSAHFEIRLIWTFLLSFVCSDKAWRTCNSKKMSVEIFEGSEEKTHWFWCWSSFFWQRKRSDNGAGGIHCTPNVGKMKK